MNAKMIFRAGAAAVLSALVMAFALAKEPTDRKGKKPSLNKGAGTPEYAILNISNLTTWHKWDGDANHSPGGDDGFIYPKGTGSLIYQDGLMWGGKVFTNAAKTISGPFHTVRVGGSFYGAGTFPGAVTGSGATAVREAPSLADVKIYRIRRDYASMSESELTSDAADVNELTSVAGVTAAMRTAVTAEYNNSWTNWPVAKGAPFIDRNNNGVYNPPPPFSTTFTVDSLISQNQDEPGVAGADPNSPADQVIWVVFNDLSEEQSKTVVSSEPLGIEVQKTLWGYKRADALGNLYFSRFKIINKGGVDVDTTNGVQAGSFWIDSMYVAQWSDPDLGNAGDDLTGCDTVLSLAFVYNGQAVDGEFQSFKLPPPAVGYDFLAGPMVPSAGSQAVFDLKRRNNFRNLGMSAYSYFSAGSPYTDPPGDYENGTGRFWKMFRGFAPLGTLTGADQPYASGVFPVSKFPLSGDPVAGTGFLDGKGTTSSFNPGDRRLLAVSGPFSMAPGDTQEVYIGTVAGIGGDRISSVAVMKFNDEFVQGTFNALFAVPSAPLSPDVKITEVDGEIMLEWGSNTARVAAIENTVQPAGGFTFEGYNVYQLPSRGSQLSEGKLIANYDAANGVTVIFDRGFDASSGRVYDRPVMYGDDDGIKRWFNFNKDHINDIEKLYNGKEYYLVVTAYTRATVAGYLPSVLESQPTVLTVQSRANFGVTNTPSQGDTVVGVAHITSGALSDGKVFPVVLNASQITGHTYKVGFKTGNTWYLVDQSTGDTLLNNQTNQTANDNSPIVHGIQWRVIGAPNGFKDFPRIADGSGVLNPPTYGSFGFAGMPYTGANDRPSVDAGGGRWGIMTGSTGATQNYAYFVSRITQGGARWPILIGKDWEVRFTAGPNYALAPDAFSGTGNLLMTVPFELWYIAATPNDASDDYRLFPYLIDSDADSVFDLAQIDNEVSGGDNDPETDWIYWVRPLNVTPGQAGYNAILANIQANVAAAVYLDPLLTNGDVMRRMVFVNWNGGSVSAGTFPANVVSQMPATGSIFRIVTNKPNTSSDAFTINTSTVQLAATAEAEKASGDRIGVYPNPYYAFNAEETSRFQRFVTFNNLPPAVTIRIFNLAGQLVRTLEKITSEPYMRWNLNNTYNFPVASGIYIAHVEATLPTDGSKITKVLKLAVIQEQEILTTY